MITAAIQCHACPEKCGNSLPGLKGIDDHVLQVFVTEARQLTDSGFCTSGPAWELMLDVDGAKKVLKWTENGWVEQ